jgi:hypothetical protein
VKLKTREAIIGLIVYRVGRFVLRRWLRKGGGIMAGRKKLGVVAALTALLGVLMFWRRKKRGEATG